MSTARKLCFIGCTLLAISELASALQVDRTVPLPCEGRFETSSAALYNLAFEWTKHKSLENWAYQETEPDSLGRQCVRVQYGTQVSVHQLFEDILPSKILKTKIDKHVCTSTDQMHEVVLLSDIILIDTLTIEIQAEIDRTAHTLRMTARSNLAVPWFLSMFESSIVRELQDSLAEYHELLARSVCAVPVSKRRRFYKSLKM